MCDKTIFQFIEEAAEVIGAEGGIQDILAAMRAFPKELELVSNCCIALWSLSVVGNNNIMKFPSWTLVYDFI